MTEPAPFGLIIRQQSPEFGRKRIESAARLVGHWQCGEQDPDDSATRPDGGPVEQPDLLGQ
jgi:hypothetical protein